MAAFREHLSLGLLQDGWEPVDPKTLPIGALAGFERDGAALILCPGLGLDLAGLQALWKQSARWSLSRRWRYTLTLLVVPWDLQQAHKVHRQLLRCRRRHWTGRLFCLGCAELAQHRFTARTRNSESRGLIARVRHSLSHWREPTPTGESVRFLQAEEKRQRELALRMHRPRVVWLWMLAWLVVSGLAHHLGSLDDPQIWFRLGAFSSGALPVDWWRLGAAAFLHTNLSHLCLDLYAVAILGALLEGYLGWLVWSALAGFGVLAGCLGSVFSPAPGPFPEASAPVFALVGAGLVLANRFRQELTARARHQLHTGAVALLVYGVYSGLRGRLDLFGALLALLVGAVYTLVLTHPKLDQLGQTSWRVPILVPLAVVATLPWLGLGMMAAQSGRPVDWGRYRARTVRDAQGAFSFVLPELFRDDGPGHWRGPLRVTARSGLAPSGPHAHWSQSQRVEGTRVVETSTSADWQVAVTAEITSNEAARSLLDRLVGTVQPLTDSPRH